MDGTKVRHPWPASLFHSSNLQRSAIVTKTSPRDNGEVRLKAAARHAESGDVHDIITELWNGVTENKRELVDKVANKVPVPFLPIEGLW